MKVGFSRVVRRHAFAAQRANKKVSVGGVGVVISGIGPAKAARLAVGNKVSVTGNVSVKSASIRTVRIRTKFPSTEPAWRPS